MFNDVVEDVYGFAWYLLGLVVCLVAILYAYNVGLRDGESRLMDKQSVSGDYIVTIITNDCEQEKSELRKELNNFTFDICKGLGLIKEAVNDTE